MGNPTWKDPIVEEVRKVRKGLDAELKKNPYKFMERAEKKAVKAGFKISSLKPIQPKRVGKKQAKR